MFLFPPERNLPNFNYRHSRPERFHRGLTGTRRTARLEGTRGRWGRSHCDANDGDAFLFGERAQRLIFEAFERGGCRVEEPAHLLPGLLPGPRGPLSEQGQSLGSASQRPERQGQRTRQAPGGDPAPALRAFPVPHGPTKAKRQDAKPYVPRRKNEARSKDGRCLAHAHLKFLRTG